MNQSLKTTPAALREAFYALSIGQEVPDAKLLDDLVRRYPEFAEELTAFAITIAVDALRCERVNDDSKQAIDPSAVSPAVSRAMSHFQNRLHAVAADEAAATNTSAEVGDAPNPFANLTRGEFSAVASGLNANTVFVVKLRDRQIEVNTMTPGFQRRVAEELNAPVDVVVAHFAASQEAAVGQYFKSEGKPEIGARQSFEDAVKSSGLSEAQQKRLLEL